MKQIISKAIGLACLAIVLLSFRHLGGEGFEIYLNNRVVVQQFGASAYTVKSFRITPYAANDQLTVKYNHCGRVGKDRTITIKDENNKVLKAWRFADGTTPAAAMNCNVKDILHMAKKHGSELKLYYASSEMPKGRLLAKIIIDNNIVARTK